MQCGCECNDSISDAAAQEQHESVDDRRHEDEEISLSLLPSKPAVDVAISDDSKARLPMRKHLCCTGTRNTELEVERSAPLEMGVYHRESVFRPAALGLDQRQM